MVSEVIASKVDREQLREQIEAKYCDVAQKPEQGFHFHTGRPLAAMLEYPTADVDALPESTIESFAGTGTRLSSGSSMRVRPCSISVAEQASIRCRLPSRSAPRAA